MKRVAAKRVRDGDDLVEEEAEWREDCTGEEEWMWLEDSFFFFFFFFFKV